MDNSDRLYFSKFSLNAEYDSFFEDDNIQDADFDGDINPLLGTTVFDETDEYFWDEN